MTISNVNCSGLAPRGDEKTLFPNMPETLKAAETLIKDGFDVMVYCSDDPIQAKMLEDMGCVAIMPPGFACDGSASTGYTAVAEVAPA